MKKKKTLALLGCSALLLSGMYFSNSKNQNSNNIDDKRNFYGTLEENGAIIDSLTEVIFEYEILLDIHPYFEPYSCENKINSLQEEIMFIGAKLDSCIIVND